MKAIITSARFDWIPQAILALSIPYFVARLLS